MRLIDADKLLKQILETTNTEENAGMLMLLTGLVNDAPTAMKWISVEDRMPDNGEVVLCYAPTNRHMFIGFHRIQTLGSYTQEHWYILTSMLSTKIMKKKVTHWMPLPKFPEVKQNETD